MRLGCFHRFLTGETIALEWKWVCRTMVLIVFPLFYSTTDMWLKQRGFFYVA